MYIYLRETKTKCISFTSHPFLTPCTFSTLNPPHYSKPERSKSNFTVVSFHTYIQYQVYCYIYSLLRCLWCNELMFRFSFILNLGTKILFHIMVVYTECTSPDLTWCMIILCIYTLTHFLYKQPFTAIIII